MDGQCSASHGTACLRDTKSKTPQITQSGSWPVTNHRKGNMTDYKNVINTILKGNLPEGFVFMQGMASWKIMFNARVVVFLIADSSVPYLDIIFQDCPNLPFINKIADQIEKKLGWRVNVITDFSFYKNLKIQRSDGAFLKTLLDAFSMRVEKGKEGWNVYKDYSDQPFGFVPNLLKMGYVGSISSDFTQINVVDDQPEVWDTICQTIDKLKFADHQVVSIKISN